MQCTCAAPIIVHLNSERLQIVPKNQNNPRPPSPVMFQNHLKPGRLAMFRLLGLWGGTQQIEDDKSSKEHYKIIPTTTNAEPAVTASDTKALPLDDNLKKRLDKCEEKVFSLLLEKGVPGLVINVTKQNRTIWTAAYGFCDVENQVRCSPDSRMRIASISKSIFASTVVAPLIDEYKLDIRSSIFNYLSEKEFPRPKFQDKEYDITIEQLLNHTSGIRHYEEEKSKPALRPISSPRSLHVYQNDDQYNRVEYYTQKNYRSVTEALSVFKDSPLVREPGNYRYSSYNYTLLSAVIEKFLQEVKSNHLQIEDHWVQVLHKDWNLKETTLDHDEPILSKRARYYMRTGENGQLINAPYVSNSVKWAGGGLISTTGDMAKLGNALIDSYKSRNSAKISRKTMDLLWDKDAPNTYALGFRVVKLDAKDYNDNFAVYHTGVALGASSILLMFPESEVVVTMICNLYETDLTSLAFFIAKQFERFPIECPDGLSTSRTQYPTSTRDSSY